MKANAATLIGGTTFNKALYNGVIAGGNTSGISYTGGNAQQAITELSSFKSADLELVLYTKTAIGDGTQANNPWLQELPDPITRLSWDNYLTVSPGDAEKLGLNNDLNARMQLGGSIVNLTVNGVTIKDVPVFDENGLFPLILL